MDHLLLKSGIYRHFKGNNYQVISVAKHSETEEDYVVYQKLYDDFGLCVRPFEMFVENVERDGYSGPRFQYLGERLLRIGIIGSMHYTEKMVEVMNELKRYGHEAFISDFHYAFIGKSDEEKERIKLDQKNNMDAIREFWNLMQGADAVLVLNFEKNGIPNYIGGNTLMEIGFAHVLNQKIFLYNPIPEIPYYQSEIEAVKPVIINRDLSKIV